MISNALPANHAPLAGESSAHQAVNKFTNDTDRSAEVVSVPVDNEATPASALFTGKQRACGRVLIVYRNAHNIRAAVCVVCEFVDGLMRR